MANVVRAELILDDGTAMQFSPAGTRQYVHAADRFNVWGQNVSYYNNHSFLKIFNSVIQERQEKLNNPDIKMISWRAHVAASLATFAKENGSTFVECGVNIGVLSGCICKLLEQTGRGKLENFYLFDTFAGIPESQFDPKKESIATFHNNKHYNEDIYEFVKGMFSKYDYVLPVQGAVPEVLADFSSIRDVSYLSLDMNIVYPEKAALEFFWDRMAPGGIVLVDDYGYAHHELQQQFYDDFCRARMVVPCHLPTGQAIILKT